MIPVVEDTSWHEVDLPLDELLVFDVFPVSFPVDKDDIFDSDDFFEANNDELSRPNNPPERRCSTALAMLRLQEKAAKMYTPCRPLARMLTYRRPGTKMAKNAVIHARPIIMANFTYKRYWVLGDWTDLSVDVFMERRRRYDFHSEVAVMR